MPGSAWTTPCSKCRRGARTASSALIPCSTARTIVCRIAERIRLEPALPRPSSISPSRRTTVGAIIDGTRRPGSIRWKPSGLRSSSPSMLLRITPVPGTSTPEPEPLEQVTLAHMPACVEDRDVGGRAEQVRRGEVEAGRVEQARSPAPRRRAPRRTPRRGRRWRRPSPRPAAPARSPRRAARAGRGRRRSGSRPRMAAGWSAPRCRGRRPGSAAAGSPHRRPGPTARACRRARGRTRSAPPRPRRGRRARRLRRRTVPALPPAPGSGTSSPSRSGRPPGA